MPAALSTAAFLWSERNWKVLLGRWDGTLSLITHSTSPTSANRMSLQVAKEPINGERGDALKRPWFFEQMGGAGDDLEALLAGKLVQCLTVQLDHHAIVAADDQQGRGPHDAQRFLGQVRPASSRDNRLDLSPPFGGDDRVVIELNRQALDKLS